MKYILVLHICSLLSGDCFESQYTGYTYNSHFDCAVAGYSVSGQTFKLLKNNDYIGIDRINKEKIAIKFECKELPST
mgnify:CR=1 FL=1|tara:strand:- start:247 stop:477 length:231 start_codon:yes stop_codon:yes gene_type:complete